MIPCFGSRASDAIAVWGPVAQWLELAAHNRLVPGSSPGGPTNDFSGLVSPFSFRPEESPRQRLLAKVRMVTAAPPVSSKSERTTSSAKRIVDWRCKLRLVSLQLLPGASAVPRPDEWVPPPPPERLVCFRDGTRCYRPSFAFVLELPLRIDQQIAVHDPARPTSLGEELLCPFLEDRLGRLSCGGV